MYSVLLFSQLYWRFEPWHNIGVVRKTTLKINFNYWTNRKSTISSLYATNWGISVNIYVINSSITVCNSIIIITLIAPLSKLSYKQMSSLWLICSSKFRYLILNVWSSWLNWFCNVDVTPGGDVILFNGLERKGGGLWSVNSEKDKTTFLTG